MKKLNDFVCECGNEFEELVEGNTVECPQCLNLALKVIRPIKFHLEGVSGHFPTASDKWARDHIKAAKVGQED